MFQNLAQGSTLSVLYKNIPRVAEGRVLSVNTHIPTFNPQQPMAMMNGLVTDITIQIGDETIPFAGLPANGVVANFPEKGLYLSTDPSAIKREVDASASALKQELDAVPAKQKLYQGYESLKLELNPDRQRDLQHEQEITSLRGEISELKDLVLALSGGIKKKEE